ncbi:hypothetical protein JQ612_27015 [Bradyrhizobium manausense]|nr:hypothetical protein [Bradyrhizobium manausense]MBR0724831.1 hypothetical protein [Bradyrhizobium manausense]MBR0836860.1 hypothetical protein [Bradyrhizobium manausense]
MRGSVGFQAQETVMNVLTNALIALGAVGVIGYALMTHLQNRAPRPRARAGGDGGGSDSYSDTTNDGFSLGSWFSSDSSSNSTDSGNCSTSDSGGGGDCGGGGDGGGGGSSD